MQKARLDLNDFLPLWERKFDNFVCETEFDRLLGSNIDLLEAPVGQGRGGNTSALAQDVFSALIVRQGRRQR